MTDIHPGSLIGLPADLLHPVFHLAWLRWVLLALAWVWAASSLFNRRVVGFVCGVAFASAAVGFWILALGRPYGLFVDHQITRQYADAVVVAATGDVNAGFLAGRPPDRSFAVGLARLGLPARFVLMLPTVAPLLSLIGVGWLIFCLVRDRRTAALASTLWLAFSAGDLDLLSGDGFLAHMWSRPLAMVLLPAIVAALLLLSRVRSHRLIVVGFALVLVVAWACAIPAVGDGRGLLAGFQALTLDQGVFLFIAAFGIWRGVALDPGTRIFLLCGATLLLTAHAGPVSIDPWAGQVLYRIGLLMVSCGPIGDAERWIGDRFAALRLLGRFDPGSLGRAALLAAAVPCSATMWWNPFSEDEIAWSSREALGQGMLRTMAWISDSTDPKASFVASSNYAAVVAAIGGRRVVRVPTLARPEDDAARRRAQRAALRGDTDDPALRRFGVGYLLLGPGDGFKWNLPSTAEFTARGLRPVFRYQDDFVVFALPR